MKEFNRNKYTIDIDLYNTILAYTSRTPLNIDRLTKLGLDRKSISGEKLVKHEFIRIVNELCENEVFAGALPEDTTIYDDRNGKEIKVTWRRGHKLSEVKHKYIIGVTKHVIVSVSEVTLKVLDADVDIVVLDNNILVDDPFKILCNCKIIDPVLSNCDWTQSITLGNGDTLWIDGDVKIEASCPIIATGAVRIRGTEGSKLTLKNIGEAQPCIGSPTNTGLAYGMWSLASGRCAEIYIECTEVHCESIVENFMLGEYGTDSVPKIILDNGATIDAVEMNGQRVRTKRQTGQLASSGFTDYPVYAIKAKEDVNAEQLLRGMEEK